MKTVTIFGKDSCPYTTDARGDFAKRGFSVDYVNVKKSAADLQRMLAVTKGARDVPVIVEGEKVTIGYGGS
jgi:glutaredoxin